MNLSKSIKVSLAKNGKTQAWLAREVYVSDNAISKMCTTNKINSERLQEICKVLDLKVSEFIALGE